MSVLQNLGNHRLVKPLHWQGSQQAPFEARLLHQADQGGKPGQPLCASYGSMWALGTAVQQGKKTRCREGSKASPELAHASAAQMTPCLSSLWTFPFKLVCLVYESLGMYQE